MQRIGTLVIAGLATALLGLPLASAEEPVPVPLPTLAACTVQGGNEPYGYVATVTCTVDGQTVSREIQPCPNHPQCYLPAKFACGIEIAGRTNCKWG